MIKSFYCFVRYRFYSWFKYRVVFGSFFESSFSCVLGLSFVLFIQFLLPFSFLRDFLILFVLLFCLLIVYFSLFREIGVRWFRFVFFITLFVGLFLGWLICG